MAPGHDLGHDPNDAVSTGKGDNDATDEMSRGTPRQDPAPKFGANGEEIGSSQNRAGPSRLSPVHNPRSPPGPAEPSHPGRDRSRFALPAPIRNLLLHG